MAGKIEYKTFNLEELGISTEEWNAMVEAEEAVYCDCGYLEENKGKEEPAIFKPDGQIHLGVRKHGWLCPRCNKFVQIG